MEPIKDIHSLEEIQARFSVLRENQFAVANQSIKERKRKLKNLKKAIEYTYREEIKTALFKDMGKHPSEVDLTEIYPVISEIKHSLNHIESWTSRQSVSTPIAFLGASSSIKYEPKGVCLIISPWNFPVNLTFCPLISAITAGNTVILKPSEMTPHISNVMSKIVEKVFDSNEITLIEGAIETSTHLLSLPFNHIFFTGAPNIGKIVMTAAAKHLSSVTLELGGKSPTIVDKTASIKTAAKRIAWGKFVNAGQVCISPDYIYVHESKKEDLVDEFKQVLKTFYGEKPIESASYNKIVNSKHADRVRALIEDAKKSGATIDTGTETTKKSNHIPPTLLTNVDINSEVMQQEIFGPVLPIITFKELEEVVKAVNSKEIPLALYIYSKSKKNIDYLIQNTRAGGTCINNNAIHFYNNNLPFGGANNSGIGKSHGEFGFKEFSNARAIYNQHVPGALEVLTPPYNSWKQKLINLTIKWF